MYISFLLVIFSFLNFSNQKKELKAEDYTIGEISSSVEQKGITRIISSSATVKIPSEKIWKILTSYDHMEEFFPSVKSSSLIKKENQYALVDYTLEIGWQELKFVQECIESDNNRFLTFKTIDGDLKNYSGSWKLEPADGKTKVTYHVSVDYDSILPDWLLNRLIKSGISYLMETIILKAASQS